MSYLATATPETEDSRTCLRRRIQQRRCLVCGARDLVNSATSYFCAAHIRTHRYCAQCEGLRTTEEHGRDSRCKPCAAAHALAYYYQNRDRCIYRIRLQQIAQRRHSRADQIFIAIRRRIALAELVRATPGWSWPQRAAVFGGTRQQIATDYQRQCRGPVPDADATDRARTRHRRQL